jgi:chromosome segregation ATPase
MEAKLAELKEKREKYQQELEELHIYEPSLEWYEARRYEIESQIAFIDDAIEEVELEIKMFNTFNTVAIGALVVFAIVSVMFMIFML